MKKKKKERRRNRREEEESELSAPHGTGFEQELFDPLALKNNEWDLGEPEHGL